MYYIISPDGHICGESAERFDTGDGFTLIAQADYQPDPQKALAAAKTAKLHAAADAAQAFIEKVAGLDTVPQFERESWAVQGQEAQAWAKDKKAPTPILAGIAKARGVPLDVLRQKALAKSQAFVMLTAAVAGQRQAMEDAIRAAEDMATLEAVAIAYTIPMMPLSPAGVS